MTKFALSAAVAAAAMLAMPMSVASAEPYVGLGYTHYDTDDGDIGGATGRLGYNFNRNLGVEGEATFSVDDDDAVELDQAYAGYVVGRLPVSQSFDLLGRVGYQNAEFSTPLGDADADGLGYGVGAQWNVNQTFGVRADYTRLEGDFDVDTIGLGGVVSF
jgi:hypothetical protein